MRQTSQPPEAAAQATPPSLMLGHLKRTANQPVPGVKRGVWRKDDEHAHLADAAFSAVRTEVLQRDNYTCRFCGFKAAKYQEVHHLDDNHQNNATQNLLTVCNLCHQVFHYGVTAMRNGAFIAAIPELTQAELNNIVRAIHVAEYVADAAVRDKLKSLFASFQYRGSDTLKTLFGLDISNLYVPTEVLSVCPDDIYAKRVELLSPLRLVGTKEAFHGGQLEYYAANNRALFLPENWPPLTRQLLM